MTLELTEPLAAFDDAMQGNKLANQVEKSAARLIQEGKPHEALSLIGAAISHNQTPALWNDWATAQYACGDPVQAEAGYRQALKMSGAYQPAAVNLGLMLFVLGRLDEAIPLLEEHKSTLTKQEMQAIGKLAAQYQAQVARDSRQLVTSVSNGIDGQSENFAVALVCPPGYIHAQALNEMVETVHYGLLALGYKSMITSRIDEPDRRVILLGAHLLKHFPPGTVKPGSILYNFEQMDSESPWIDKAYLELLRLHTVWDYSERNIAWLEKNGVQNAKYVPIGWMPPITRIAPAVQDIDVLFYGSMNERRATILKDLKAHGVHVEHVFGIYGKERDALIARSKIVLNMHYYESQIFELARVSYLLANNVCVVSEDGLDPAEAEFSKGVTFAPYGKIVDTCLNLLSDADARGRLSALGKTLMQSRHESEYLKAALAPANDSGDDMRRIPVKSGHVTSMPQVAIPGVLNIGSGKDWKEEAINLDVEAEWGPDVLFDLNRPLPPTGVELTSARFGKMILKEDSFDLIHAYDVLEHIPKLSTAMTTCLALLKVGGVFSINVPYDLSWGAWQDPTHVRAFNERSWLYYTDWFWYLGWNRWRFDLIKLDYVLSPVGQKLQGEGIKLEELTRTPRAVDSMRVQLRKRFLTSEESLILKARRPRSNSASKS